MNHLGKHGMPAGLYADWNDCLRLGADGESTFVALQFYYAMTILKEFAAYKKDDEYIAYLDESQENSERSFRSFAGTRTDLSVDLQGMDRLLESVMILRQICGSTHRAGLL